MATVPLPFVALCSLLAGTAALSAVLLSFGAASLEPLVGAVGSIESMFESADGPLAYLLVFLGAATPWLEILVVVPIGVLYGLNPVLVATVAFLGNILTVYALIAAADRVTDALRRWRGESESSARRERAARVWNRYGMPGLAMGSPILTGVHLAVLIAFGFGAKKRSTTVWMTASLALWTVIITALSVTGAGALSAIR
ncbi:small multi-drug export protein [Halobacteria archaeon AArc-dxtr1]|nr:small multi-drug export protein [Halobacteria archaeon AArc-dxtr1]